MEANVPTSFKEVTTGEAKLLLLNELECQALLRSFADFAASFTAKISEADADTIERELPEFRKGILDHREKVFRSLSTVYAHKET